jgi:fatty acid/phospholipid biosynthesis enzyme
MINIAVDAMGGDQALDRHADWRHIGLTTSTLPTSFR